MTDEVMRPDEVDFPGMVRLCPGVLSDPSLQGEVSAGLDTDREELQTYH